MLKVVLIFWLYYRFASCVDDSRRFTTRVNDKSHRMRLTGGERIFRLYEINFHNILEVVDETHHFFRMTSKNIEGLWYYVSLATHFCRCLSKSSSCKYLVGMKMILKTHYLHIHMNDNNELSSKVNVGEVIGHINVNFGEYLPSINNNVKFTTTDFEGELIPQYTHEGVSSSTSCGKQKHLFWQGMENLVEKFDSMKIELEIMSVDELEHKLKIVKRCITSLHEPYTLNILSTISLPSRGSIYSIQKNVRQTRVGHGKQHESQIQKEPQPFQPRPKPTRPIHVLLCRPK